VRSRRKQSLVLRAPPFSNGRVHISAVTASGYRNLAGRIELCHPLAVIAGENNAGKSNVIDALRTVLEPEAGPRGRCWLRDSDFAHDGRGNRTTDELCLEVELGGVTAEEQGRMVTCLAPEAGEGVAKIRLRATIGADGRVTTQWFGGDSEQADVERYARTAVRFVYLHPLRDAGGDLRPGRDNKLIGLIGALAPRGHADQDAIVAAAAAANAQLDSIEAITKARALVADGLRGMTGRGRFVQQTGLAFDDPRFERVVGSLRAKIGELAALDMEQNGLGFNNLLYMAVLLAALAEEPAAEDDGLRVLLVEEPEAHLHPQLQDLLMHFLEAKAAERTQVIVTTHSPNFASSAKVERLTVLARPAAEPPVARLPRDFGLTPKQFAYLRRFLDVTKASLLFARGAILVEGVAEQLLVPVIAKRLKRPLAANGVSVINVGGTAFPPFTELFGKDKLPYPVAVISDADPGDVDDDTDEALSPRAARLKERERENLRVELAQRTLEWDLAEAQDGANVPLMLDALSAVRRKAGPTLAKRLEGKSAIESANAILAAVAGVKGPFAQELAELIGNPMNNFTPPDYVRRAIEWVADEIPDDESKDVADAAATLVTNAAASAAGDPAATPRFDEGKTETP
jgi:putative ATP-dependent endonuclease of the OLD family